MHERLVENWLDSSSERAYQTPFCQMLVGNGHRIIHNTRHSPTEFGKDVISQGPDGRVWAFQLKGNPGSRLTLKQFRQIQEQLQELVSYPVRGTTAGWHRSFLVTNGEIDEEAQDAIIQFNEGNARAGYDERRLEVISRGQLLAWANDLGVALWPSELPDVNALLELMIHDGRSQLPLEKYHALLLKNLRLGEKDAAFAGKDDFVRHVTSTAVLVSLALRNFQTERNHYAVLCAWVLYSTYVTASARKWKFSYRTCAAPSVEIAKDAIFAALRSICDDLRGEDVLLSGDPRAAPFVYRTRFTLVCALMSLYWFWCESGGWPDEAHKPALKAFLAAGFRRHHLWGEGAVPQFLVYMWRSSEVSSSAMADWTVGDLLDAIVTLNNSEDKERNLANPYFSAENVLRHQLKDLVDQNKDVIAKESFFGQSYFAESLMHLLVRANAKQHCKRNWPELSRLGFSEFKPSSEWRYCLWRTTEGETLHRQPPLTKNWDDLVEEARDCSGEGIPDELLSDRHLHMLFVILCPHRGTGAAIRHLARRFTSTWFIPAPIVERRTVVSGTTSKTKTKAKTKSKIKKAVV